jgi:elongation factor 1-alpha
MIENKLKIAIAGNVDAGKCFAENTILLDKNHFHIKVKEIRLGDKLLGYKDNVTVIDIHRGWGKLYRITLLNRDIYFDVTYNHQLVLKYMDIEKILSKNEYFELMNYKDSDGLIIITIESYLNLTNKQKKCLFCINKKDKHFFRFKVKYKRIGKWVGITVDGDHKVILKDYIITHNSSLIGVLKTGKLDDGRGSARKIIMKHNHELETGRTSAITMTPISLNNDKKVVTLIDLAGHEKYLKTTVFGLNGYFVDYGIVIVDCNRGITRMTKEHLGILLYLKIPFMVLLTKIDMAPEQQLQRTKRILRKLLKIKLFNTRAYFINQEEKKATDEINTLLINNTISTQIIPILQISNKTGHNIENVKNIMGILKPRVHWDKNKFNGTLVHVDSNFEVKGIGLVFSGTVKGDPVITNGKYWIGPVNNKFYNIKARSLHNNRRQIVDKVENGEIVCIAIRFLGKDSFERKQIKKGLMIFSDKSFEENVVRKFKANIRILNHSTTLRNNYTPIIHCNCTRQSAKLRLLDGNKETVLRAGESATVMFEFLTRNEYLEVGNSFFFLDGKTKGMGNIIKLL